METFSGFDALVCSASVWPSAGRFAALIVVSACGWLLAYLVSERLRGGK
jgi:hypothetical protein